MPKHQFSQWISKHHTLLEDTLITVLVCLCWCFAQPEKSSTPFSGWSFSWSPQWCAFWSVMLTLPYILHRVRPRTSLHWFMTVFILQILIGPDLLPANIICFVMFYTAITYITPSKTKRYIVTAFILGALVALHYTITTTFITISGLIHALIQHDDLLTHRQCVLYENASFICHSSFLQQLIPTSIGITLMLVLALVAGFWQRARHQTLQLLNERNEAIRAREQEEALIATSAERARIARDMHDVVAHTLSIIIVQSDGGRYAATHDPQLARRTMQTIRSESEHALHDMHNLLSVFHNEQQADYHDIDALITQAKHISTDITLIRSITGKAAVHHLSQEASIALYHVVQEALTNIRKYAGNNVTVHVYEQWSDSALQITIEDDGQGAAASLDGHTPGFGLMGMCERIQAINGSVVYGPRVGGGFEVIAQVPLTHATTFIGNQANAIETSTVLPLQPASLSQSQNAENALTLPNSTSDTQTDAYNGDDNSIESSKSFHWSSLLHLSQQLRSQPIEQTREGKANWVVRLSYWCEKHYVLMDTCGALLFILFGSLAAADITYPTPKWIVILTVVLLLLPLSLRRRFPQTTALIFAVVCLLQFFFSAIYLANLAAPLYIYSAVTYGSRKNWRWIVPLYCVESILLGVRCFLYYEGYSTIMAWLTHAQPYLITYKPTPMSIFIEFTVLPIVICTITLLFGIWVRISGSNPQVLQARTEALQEEQKKQRIAAANKERDRISANIQSEVSQTLHIVIDQTTQEINTLESQLKIGDTPSPESISKAFASISEQGRKALARMRQLLHVLRETGFSDNHTDSEARMTMPLKPVEAMMPAHDADNNHATYSKK